MDNLLAGSGDSMLGSLGGNSSTDSVDSSYAFNPSTAPSYLQSSDLHTIASTGGGSWFDPDTWADRLGNAGKFMAVSMLSGADSIYNSAATVGKWAGLDDGTHDTGAWISSLDDDLGTYYQSNKQAADLAGFVMTSFIPGLAGTKLLNVGRKVLQGASESGVIGTTLSKATGLLVPDAAKYVALSGSEIAQSAGTMGMINKATLQALGAGVINNTLEAAAFETMVQATMFKSPILEDQDGYDIAKNIAFGGFLGGAIGGTIEGVKSVSAISKAVNGELTITRGFSSTSSKIATATPEDQRILLIAESRDSRAMPLPGSENYTTNQQVYNAGIQKDNNAIRTSIHNLSTSGDTTIANMTADALHNVPATDLLGSIANATEISSLASMNKVDRVMKATLSTLSDEDIEAARGLQNRFVTLTGENAGNVLDSEPLVANLADTVKPNANVSMKDAVLNAVKEQGHSLSDDWDAGALVGDKGHLQAEGRYIWAKHVLGDIPAGTVINSHDLPVLQRLQSDMASGASDLSDYASVKIKYPDGSTTTGINGKDLAKLIETSKGEVVDQLQNAMTAPEASIKNAIPIDQGNEAIAKIADVKLNYLEGQRSPNIADDLYATDSNNTAYNKMLVDKGLRSEASIAKDPEFTELRPKFAKVAYDTNQLQGLNGNQLDAMVELKQKQVLFQQAADNVAMKNMGDKIFNACPTIDDSALMNAKLSDASPGLFSFQSGAVGSLGSLVQQVGANVTRPLRQLFTKASEDALNSALLKLGSNQEAAIEFDVLSNKIANTAEQYVQDTKGYIKGGGNNLIAKKYADYYDAVASGSGKTYDIPVLEQGTPISMPVQNQETWDAITAHSSRDYDRLMMTNEANAVLGKTNTVHLNSYEPSLPQNPIFAPIRPNPNDYTHIAFVKDSAVTGSGHTSMIYADSAENLQKLTSLVPTDGTLSVIRKGETEDFFKAQGEYSYDQSLNSNYIDSQLKSNGVASNYFTKTDPQKIINDIMQQHLRADDVAATNLVRLKYQPQFDFLESQAEQMQNLSESKFGVTSGIGTGSKDFSNPYTDFIKSALDISNTSKYPLLQNANRVIDQAVSKAYDTVSSLWQDAKSPADMDRINDTLQKFGIDTAYSNAASDALINHTATKGALSSFVRASNGILINCVMGLDAISGLHRALGSVILRSSVFGNLITGLENGDASIAGKLADLGKIAVPGVDASAGEGALMLSPAKLQANAYQAWWKDITDTIGQDGPLMQQARAEGAVHSNVLSGVQDVMKRLTLKGTEADAELGDATQDAFTMAKALELGKKLSGTTMLDEMNRFVSWHCGKQLTDLGEEAGLLTSAEAQAYRNTLVNQVDGVSTASQRPLAFQGPVGQALGLFQGYQFNMMQQMFKYIGEGAGKDTATLLGLQGTMYGLQGEPLFQAINDHVVGNMSGNKNHTDMYAAAQGILGKTAGDFLMYGVPSNILQTNMYSRGEINPRSVSILPTKIEDIPTVAAYSKLIGSLYDTLGKVAGGGNVWESVLQGLEHNGVSRPLAGLAQTLQTTTGNGVAFSTTSKGTIIGSNDLLSLATLSRLAGAKPLDESIINDTAYRIQSYEAAQKVDMQNLIDTIKTTQIQGQQTDEASLSQFTAKYAALGGKQQNFNQLMMNTMKSANTSAAAKINQVLSNPFNQRMQTIMGGTDPMSSGQAASTGGMISTGMGSTNAVSNIQSQN